jgi:hypothetical protein
MAYSLIAHTVDSLGTNGGTGSTIDTRGSDLLIIAVGYYSGINTIGATDVSDSKSNSYTALTGQTSDNGEGATRFFYCQGGATDAAHSITVTKSSVFVAASFSAWSGSVASPFDQENGQGSTGSLSVIGSNFITPTETNTLVLSVASAFTTAGPQATLLTPLDAIGGVGGTSYDCAVSYSIQTTATVVTELWNISPSYRCSAAIANFKDTPSASGRIWVLAGNGGGLAGPARGLAGYRSV